MADTNDFTAILPSTSSAARESRRDPNHHRSKSYVASKANHVEEESATGTIQSGVENELGVGDHPPRLVLVSSRVKHVQGMTRALAPNVIMVQYRYESSSLDDILGTVAQSLGTCKVESIGLVLHGSGGQIFLCYEGEKILTTQTIIEQVSIREFFSTLIENHIDPTWINARMDFLACAAAELIDGGLIAREIETLAPFELTVSVAPDLVGTGVYVQRIGVEDMREMTVGELYFQVHLLGSSGAGVPGGNIGGARTKLGQQTAPTTTADYEKIRVVGKGSFGAAVLYRRKDDDSLVVIKEINMHDLNSQERQLALNEVAVLSKLEHPNIISYYDSFEEDGILMIEMEYAEGGTLSTYLARRERPLEEKEILVMFNQMVSATCYLHESNILHRDLKTANIFLTKEATIKVGDFGISKVMNTVAKEQGAMTVVGTPYYISPEMCEGKPYNEKSDMWALGCILYEMACLQKTFEGSNLPLLVNKIMSGQYEQVRGNYSSEFKALVKDLLQKEPAVRPTAQELLHTRLAELLSRYEGHDEGGEWVDGYSSSTTGSGGGGHRTMRQKVRSVLYAFDPVNLRLHPVDLPIKVKIRQVTVSPSHVMVVTSEKLVYGWGDNSCGQLGVGDKHDRAYPCLIEVLTGKSICKLATGNRFSVFCSDNGLVMTCGKAQFLGHRGLEDDLIRPKLVDALLSVDILAIACGPEHTLALGEGGKVFAWGNGSDGRLGTGLEQNEQEPVQLRIPNSCLVRDVRCGFDGSILLTDAGTLLAMGSNKCNKLLLNKRQGFFSHVKLMKAEVEKTLAPCPVKCFGYRVIDVSMGPNHTAVLLESGHVHIFGQNTKGQLGRGNKQPVHNSVIVKELEEKTAVMVQCGEDFTIAATSENALYYWGARRSTTNAGFTSAITPKMGMAEIKSTRLETIPSVAHGTDLDDEISEKSNIAEEPTTVKELLRKTSAGSSKPVAFVHPFGLSDSAAALGDKLLGGERQRHQSGTGRRKSLISNASIQQRLAAVSEQTTDAAATAGHISDNTSAETETILLSNSGGKSTGGINEASNLPLVQTTTVPPGVISSTTSLPAAASSCGGKSAGTSRLFKRGQAAQEPVVQADDNTICTPTQILRLDSSKSQYSHHATTISLGPVVCCGWDILVVVETTAPLPKHQHQRQRQRHGHYPKFHGAVHPRQQTTAVVSSLPRIVGAKEIVSTGQTGPAVVAVGPVGRSIFEETNVSDMPTWIKKELDDAEVLLMSAAAPIATGPPTETPPVTAPKERKRDVPRESLSSSDDEDEDVRRKKKVSTKKTHHPRNASEIERLQKEKVETEVKLTFLEVEFIRQQQEQQMAKAREEQLQEQILLLRSQLETQNREYASRRMSINREKTASDSRAPVQSVAERQKNKKSRLCSIQ